MSGRQNVRANKARLVESFLVKIVAKELVCRKLEALTEVKSYFLLQNLKLVWFLPILHEFNKHGQKEKKLESG